MVFDDFWNLLWIFVFVPPVIYFYLKHKTKGSLRFSSTHLLEQIKKPSSLKWRHAVIVLRVLAMSLLVICLMRPQQGIEETKIETEGIDIILAIDVSGSMQAEDFVVNGERMNRLEAVKDVVHDFIKKRHNDRIGLVVFAGRSYVQCPLTLDYGVLLQFLERIEIGMIEDGTAVGDGLAMALSRLQKIESKSKIVILLTDGVNNAGQIGPRNAAELAQAVKVKVYTIGAGAKGRVPFPAKDFFGNKVYQWANIDLDEDTLRYIAETTQGQYYRAYDTNSLKQIYEQIDRLEKTKVEVDSYMEYKELFPLLALIALILLLSEMILKNTRFRTIP